MNYKSKPRERNYARLDQYLIDHDLYAGNVGDVTTVEDTVTGAEVTITRQTMIAFGGSQSHTYALSVDGLTVTAHKHLDAVWMAALALVGVRE